MRSVYISHHPVTPRSNHKVTPANVYPIQGFHPACLESTDTQLSLPEIAEIQLKCIEMREYVLRRTQQNATVVYGLQNKLLFTRNHRDILHLIRQLEKELESPRSAQMIAFSFALRWLYREQILLRKELGEGDVIQRRSNPQGRGTAA